jgi:hypothetical protein
MSDFKRAVLIFITDCICSVEMLEGDMDDGDVKPNWESIEELTMNCNTRVEVLKSFLFVLRCAVS